MLAAPAILDAPAPAPGLATRSRVALWVAVVLPVLCAFAPRDLWSPDEPRYGVVARGMLETGDVLVPRIAGRPYAEKPPLVFAAAAGVGALRGRLDAVGMRLPSALLAALAIAMTARLARRWFGDPGIGDTAALLFATTALVLWNAPRAGLDLPMTAFALLALDAGTTVVARGSTPAALGFGLALGAGLLTKGPHVLFVPVAALVGGCVAAGRPRRLLDPRWLLGLAVAAGIALAWLLPALAIAGDEIAYDGVATFRERVLGQLSSRVTGDDASHVHGPFFLVPLLLAFGLPWTPVWVAGLGRALRTRGVAAADRFGLGAAAWGLLAPLVLLSVPASKRELYLIPLLPCASILAAYAIHRWTDARAGRRVCAALAAAGLAIAVVAVAAPIVVASGALPLRREAVAVVSTLALGPVAWALGAVALLAVVGAWAARRIRDDAAAGVRAFGVAGAAAAVVLTIAVVPAFEPWKTFAPAARAAAAVDPRAPLAIWGFSDASVTWWFLGRRFLDLGVDDYSRAARALAPDGPPVLLLAKEKAWRERAHRAAPADRAVLDGARRAVGAPGRGLDLLLADERASMSRPGGITPTMTRDVQLSVVVPVHDEEGNLPALWDELRAALEATGLSSEVLFVNDGSTDASGAILDSIRSGDPRVRVLDHDRNHGLTAALDTGFRHARGAVIAMLDADLQNPPGELVKLLAHLPEADMVIGWRKDRRDPWLKRVSSRLANAYRNRRTNEHVHDTGCALKVFRREVIERVKLWKGMHRFLPTLARMEGFRVVETPVAHRPRGSGKSHFGVWNRLWIGIADVRAVRWMWKRRITASATERASGTPSPGPSA